MEERTIYVAFDGATFSDPEICRRYERLLQRWRQADEQLVQPMEAKTKNGRSTGLLNFGFLEPEGFLSVTPEEFLEQMELLQQLAAFMASED